MLRSQVLLPTYRAGVMAAAVVSVAFLTVVTSHRVTGNELLLTILLGALAGLACLTPAPLAAIRADTLRAALATIAVLTLPPGQAAAMLGAGIVAGNLYLHRPWTIAAFEAARGMLAVAAAGVVYQHFAAVSLVAQQRDASSLLALIPASATLYVLSALLPGIATVFQRREAAADNWIARYTADLASWLVLVALGAALTPTFERAPWLLLIAAAPAAALRLTRRTTAGFDAEVVHIVEEIADAAESRHPYLAGSSRRIAALAASLARARGLTEDECRQVQLAARLHDVAMSLLPEFVELGGRGSVDEHQRFFWATHCEVGADLIAWLLHMPAVAAAIEFHHERIDGKGYPHGRRGLDIPLEARIVAVAEAWIALRSERGYRPALNREQALSVLDAGAGRQWDAALVESLARLERSETFQAESGPALPRRSGIATALIAAHSG